MKPSLSSLCSLSPFCKLTPLVTSFSPVVSTPSCIHLPRRRLSFALQPGLLPRLSICISSFLRILTLQRTLTLSVEDLALLHSCPYVHLCLHPSPSYLRALRSFSCSSLNLRSPAWLTFQLHIQYMGTGGCPTWWLSDKESASNAGTV